MVKHLENASEKKKTKLTTNWGISDLIEEFWVGLAHDKNFQKMATFFEAHPELRSELSNNDYFAKTNLKNGLSFGDYSKQKLEEEKFVNPIFTNYKLVSLD
jgi:hypothetical protein